MPLPFKIPQNTLPPGAVQIGRTLTFRERWEEKPTCRICGVEEMPNLAGFTFSAACTCAGKVHESCLAATYNRPVCTLCHSTGRLPPGPTGEHQRGTCDVSMYMYVEPAAAGAGQVPPAAGQEPQPEAVIRVQVTPEQPDPVGHIRQALSMLTGQVRILTLHELVEWGRCRFELINKTTGDRQRLQAHEVPAALRKVFKRSPQQSPCLRAAMASTDRGAAVSAYEEAHQLAVLWPAE